MHPAGVPEYHYHDATTRLPRMHSEVSTLLYIGNWPWLYVRPRQTALLIDRRPLLTADDKARFCVTRCVLPHKHITERGLADTLLGS